MKYVLRGRIPSKKNSRIMIFKNRKFPMSIPTPKYTQWHKEQSLALSNQVPEVPIKTCSMIITFFLPDRRRTDLINKAESILDLFVDIKIIEDDDWLCVNSLHLASGGIDRETPRAEIEIINIIESGI